MGQLANDIIEGWCCKVCGCYFKHPDKDELYAHGHPVVCWDCWKDMSKKERRHNTRAITKLI